MVYFSFESVGMKIMEGTEALEFKDDRRNFLYHPGPMDLSLVYIWVKPSGYSSSHTALLDDPEASTAGCIVYQNRLCRSSRNWQVILWAEGLRAAVQKEGLCHGKRSARTLFTE